MALLGDFLREPGVQQVIVCTKCDGTRADDRDNGLLLHAREKLIPKGIVEFSDHAQFCYLIVPRPFEAEASINLRNPALLWTARGVRVLQNGSLVSSVIAYNNGAANGERPRDESLHNGRF